MINQKQGRNVCKFMDGNKINTNGNEVTNMWLSAKSILNPFYTRNITVGMKKSYTLYFGLNGCSIIYIYIYKIIFGVQKSSK